MCLSIKGQVDAFAKILFIVAAAIAFLLVYLYFNRFIVSTTEERTSSNFRVQTLNTLQKLVTSHDCLAYAQNETPYKIVIDKNKLNDFSVKYIDVEPDCAKALDFDYNIKVVQFEHEFTLYPGEEHTESAPQWVNSLAWHSYLYDSTHVYYALCNFKPDDVYCQPGSGELDGPDCGWQNIPECPASCWDNPDNCPQVSSGAPMCCINYVCPIEKCEIKINSIGGHMYVTICNVNLSTDCQVYHSCLHKWCGQVSIDIPKPVANLTKIHIEQKIWSFGLTAGVTSFSPEKAKQEELQLSLPITIRHNDTFSAEGIIYIYTVRGELEDLISILEDICEKANADDTKDIKFSKNFHFSYPVSYSTPTNSLCMINSCKKFVCPYNLDFQDIANEGDYILKFNFDSNSKIITVKK